MSQSANTSRINNGELLDFFRCRIGNLTSNSVKDYSKALAFLDGFIPCESYSLVTPSATLVREWCIYLFNAGMTKKTVSHYIDIISGLYSSAVGEGLVEATEVFRRVKTDIKDIETLKSGERIREEDYSRLRNLACCSTSLPKDVAMFIDIFVLSILTGCRPFSEIALIKKADIANEPLWVSSILERYCNNNRKYVFPLSQSERTERQLERDLDAGINAALQSRGIKTFGSLADTARCYWAYAAMKCGLTPSAIYSMLGTYPKAFPEIGIRKQSIPTTTDTETILRTIADAFLFNPLNWYAMRLRPRVKIAEIEKRIAISEHELRRPELFYPSREIAKRIGKKTLLEEIPVISDIVFFKTRVTDIYPLFLKIGDLAWCYRSGNGGGAYAAIPKVSMEQFQRAIGQFTPDYEVGPIGSIKPQPGDIIKIIDGTFAGNEGELLKIMEAGEQGIIYRLRIIDDQGVEWKVRVDARLTRNESFR